MPEVEELSMQAAIYARVSTTDQNCQSQLSELRDYCQRRGWDIAKEYVDLGWSGTKASRPQLDKLMADAIAHRFDVVLVYKLDRFGRSVLHLVDSLDRLAKAGVRFLATSQSIDTDEKSPSSKLMLWILAAVAEFERELIRERVGSGVQEYQKAYAAGKIGKDRHSRSGKDLPQGRPAKIFRRDYAKALRKQGMSYRKIGAKLGVPEATIRLALKAQQKG